MEGSHNLSPDAKVRYKKMIEQHNAAEANKNKNKRHNLLFFIRKQLISKERGQSKFFVKSNTFTISF